MHCDSCLAHPLLLHRQLAVLAPREPVHPTIEWDEYSETVPEQPVQQPDPHWDAHFNAMIDDDDGAPASLKLQFMSNVRAFSESVLCLTKEGDLQVPR